MHPILIELKDNFFPSFIKSELVEIQTFNKPIQKEEEAIIKHVSEKRKKEFRAGRYCCAKALEYFDVPNFPVLFDEKRSPIWPNGYCGSITHTNDLCIAAIAKTNSTPSIGIDLERLGRLKQKLWKAILTTNEITFISTLPKNDQDNFASLIFSAKECFYKYQYFLTKKWLGFLDAKVDINLAKQEFVISLLVEQNSSLTKNSSYKGKFLLLKDHIITGMW